MLALDPVPVFPTSQVDSFSQVWETILVYIVKFYNLVSDNYALQILALVGIISAAVEIVIFFQNRGDKE